MNPYAWAWRLLQTIPSIDEMGAALILIEIGDVAVRIAIPVGILDGAVSWQPRAGQAVPHAAR
jgi:hypothetical protein